MRLNKLEIEGVNAKFNQLQNVTDFCSLLNEVNNIHSSKKVKKIEADEVLYYAYSKNKFYKLFHIPKKTGGFRVITAPPKRLKEILKPLNIILQCIYIPNINSHGFIWQKSIVTNAALHTNKNYVYNIDLKDFFPSINQSRFNKRLNFPPFSLNGDRFELANIISGLCCYKSKEMLKGSLPQGAPTSPTVSNVICERLDRRLTGACKKFRVNYTRYADDLTFSSNHNVYQKNGKFLDEVERIISEQNFEINPIKTRLQKKGFRQEVTGLIVNEKVNVSRKFIKEIRTLLHLIDCYGLDQAKEIFIKNSSHRKTTVEYKTIPEIQIVLKGKLEFLKMVKGSEDSTFLKLSKKYYDIINSL